MVKILYGVCGEGMGHAIRSKILIDSLKNDHDIFIVAGNKSYSYLSKNFDNVEKIVSMSFIYKENKLRPILTMINTIYKMITKVPISLLKVNKIIKKFNPDIIITDADPISHYCAKINKLKTVSIDNVHAMIYRKHNVKFGEFITRFLLFVSIKVGMFNADKYIIYDFSNKSSTDKKVIFLNPLIQENIEKQKSYYGNHILIYQTSIKSTKYLRKMLKNINEKFIIYGYNKNKVYNNLIFKKFNDDEFYQDLSNAKAVVTNGGFTLISESLYLKKPIFCLPIKHQFEQILNGKFVEKMGIGEYHMEFSNEKFNIFLNNINKYKLTLNKYKTINTSKTINIIKHEILKITKMNRNVNKSLYNIK